MSKRGCDDRDIPQSRCGDRLLWPIQHDKQWKPVRKGRGIQGAVSGTPGPRLPRNRRSLRRTRPIPRRPFSDTWPRPRKGRIFRSSTLIDTPYCHSRLDLRPPRARQRGIQRFQPVPGTGPRARGGMRRHDEIARFVGFDKALRSFPYGGDRPVRHGRHAIQDR